MKFSAIVRNQVSSIGKYGKITSKHLSAFVGKRVSVVIEEGENENKSK